MTRSWAADARPSTYAEGRERPAVSWSDVKIIALLSHLESNKGPQGLYMKDQSTALKEAQAAVIKVTPPGETFPEPRHIAGKHYRLVVKFTPEEETRNTKELYIHGCAHLTLLPEKYRPERLPRQTSAASPVDDPLADVEMPDSETQQAIAVEIVGPRTSTLTPYYGSDAKFTNIGLPENKVNEGEVALSSTSSRDLLVVSGETLNDHLGERTESAQRLEAIPSTPRAPPRSQVAPQPPQNIDVSRQKRIRQRFIDLQDADHDTENPTPTHVSREMIQIQDKILLVVQAFLESTGVDEETPLNLRTVDFAIGGRDFLTVAQRIFHNPTDSNIIDMVSKHQKVASLSLFSFLRSFIGATIMEKVFLDWTTTFEVKTDRSEYLEEYYLNTDRELAGLILLACRRRFLKDKKSPRIRSEAEILARELDSSLTSFTACPPSQTRRPSARCDSRHGKSASWPQNWQDGLESIFQSSLHLRLSLAMSSIEYEYRWPRSNANYDAQWMGTEDGSPPKGGPRKVYLSLMPAIIPRDRKKGGERPLSKAIVILFPLEKGQVQGGQCY